jgi:YVTN family beta-propeller protein
LEFDGSSIWVMNQGSYVSKVSVSDGSYLGTFAVTGTPWAAVSVGTTMWVASSASLNLTPDGGGSFTALSPLGETLRRFDIRQQPIAFVPVQPDGLSEPLLYFVDLNSPFLFRMDPTTGAVTTLGLIAPALGSGPYALLFDGTNLWISNVFNNTVSKMDLSGVRQGTFPVGSMPTGLAFDGNNIWVANSNDNTVTKLRANDGQIQKIIETGINPGWIAFDGANVWVTNMGSNTLTKIRASDGVVLDNIATGSMPAGVVFDGAHIWVANSGSNTISKY